MNKQNLKIVRSVSLGFGVGQIIGVKLNWLRKNAKIAAASFKKTSRDLIAV